MRLNNLLRFFILFCISIIGCTNTNNTPPVISFPTQTSIPITETPTPLTQTITPTLTPTTIPTLSVNDAHKRLLELLANNGNCYLPCLWGITPGKSGYLDARSILLPLRDIAETAYFDFTSSPVDDISPIYVESDVRLYTRLAYVYGDDGVVNYMIFRAIEQQLSNDKYGNQLTTPIFDSPTFLKRVQYYSLSHVLSEQGMPDSVMVQASGELVGGAMDIALLYPEQGLWVNYTMPIIYHNGIVKRSCPANAYINMFLVPPRNPDAFFSLLDKTDWAATKVGYKTLEEVTSMSVEQFYETFRQPTDKCIETPSNLWPTPENLGNN